MIRHWLGAAALAALLVPAGAVAQDDPPFECDDRFGQCGTPDTSGGGCGCGGGGSILVANTDLGDTYQSGDDYDNDGVEDPYDNCPGVFNPDQGDSDGDSIGDACDNCLSAGNGDQADLDGEGIGDACDPDVDGDDVPNATDNCELVPNPAQDNLGGSAAGDACDDDIDGDGRPNLTDPCPMNAAIDTPTPDQLDECFPDADGDGVSEVDPLAPDNCPSVYNDGQVDADGDGAGDECDSDRDDDSILNHLDNCMGLTNPGQADGDRDGLGDDCDTEYCYVVFGNESACLNPQSAWRVYVPDLLTEVGRRIRLPFFGNQDIPTGEEVSYTWRIKSAPSGSEARIQNPSGTGTVFQSHEFVYDSDRVVSLTADQPGLYELEVSATITVDGVTSEVDAVGRHTMRLVANGEPTGGGCSVSGSSRGGALAWLLLAGVLPIAALRRRRR